VKFHHLDGISDQRTTDLQHINGHSLALGLRGSGSGVRLEPGLELSFGLRASVAYSSEVTKPHECRFQPKS